MCDAVVDGAPSTVLMPERYQFKLDATIPKKVAEPVAKVTQPGPLAVAAARAGQVAMSSVQHTAAPFNVQRANAVSPCGSGNAGISRRMPAPSTRVQLVAIARTA